MYFDIGLVIFFIFSWKRL